MGGLSGDLSDSKFNEILCDLKEKFQGELYIRSMIMHIKNGAPSMKNVPGVSHFSYKLPGICKNAWRWNRYYD